MDTREFCNGISNFGKIKQLDIEEMALFLDSISDYEGTPWTEWFQTTFCDNCSPVEKDGQEWSRCELNDEGFPCRCGELKDKPTHEIVLAWLNPQYYQNKFGGLE